MALNLQHQTAEQFVARLRERWREAEKDEKARLGSWLLARYNAGDVTATQIKNAFNFDNAQLSTFAARLQTLSDARAVIQAEQRGD
jgi:hypothetical protein